MSDSARGYLVCSYPWAVDDRASPSCGQPAIVFHMKRGKFLCSRCARHAGIPEGEDGVPISREEALCLEVQES